MQIIISFLTLLIAVFVAYIAWQQYNLAANKLKFDLYEKRYRIYQVINNYLLQLQKDTANAFQEDGLLMDYQSYVDFNLATKETPFLFDTDIIDYLAEIRDKAVLLIKAYNALKDHVNFKMYSPERGEKLEDYKQTIAWLQEEVHALEEHFEGYLGFRHLK